MSKLLGEWFAAGPARHYVLRVESLFGGRRAKSSIDAIADGIQAGRPVRAFVDRVVSPSYVDDVVAVTRTLLDRRPEAGVYHCVNSGYATWVDVAREIATLADRPDAPIEAVRIADARLKAPRPLFAALSNDKLRAVGITLPSWQDALSRYYRMRSGAATR
jgi:dTDP-4-dehydrorhamnose reductase